MNSCEIWRNSPKLYILPLVVYLWEIEFTVLFQVPNVKEWEEIQVGFNDNGTFPDAMELLMANT